MPRVSVVIPTRNRAGLLGVAIDSALRQTFRDLEVVVVDDASEDHTAEVVRGFTDARLRSLRHETRQGGSAARNTGLGASTGEFVAFLDDDDEWLPEKLELQMEVFERGGPRLGVVYTGYLVVDRAQGTVLGRKIPEKRGDLEHQLLANNSLGGTSSVLLRRICLEKAGAFDETLPSYQDYDLWIRISKHFEFDFIEKPLMKYYVHEKTIWRDPDALARGLDIMLAKYGSSRAMRRNLSNSCLWLGVQYCFAGRADRGRQNFLKAVRLYPFEARHYLNLLLSLFGAGVFRNVKQLKERIRGTLRGGASPLREGEKLR